MLVDLTKELYRHFFPPKVPPKPKPKIEVVEAVEQDVIEAAIVQRFETHGRIVHVIDKIASAIGMRNPEEREETLKSMREGTTDPALLEAIDDYGRKNAQESWPAFPKPLSIEAEFIGPELIAEIFSDYNMRTAKAWAIFDERFPGYRGLITLSRLGIDTKHTVALLYVGHQCGYWEGEGFTHILRNDGSGWRMEKDEHGRWLAHGTCYVS